MDDKLKYWVWTALAAGPGSRTVWEILGHFDYDPEKLYNADEDEIFALPAVNRSKLRAYCDKSLDEAERIADWCANNFTTIITPESEYYPSRLKEITNPPVVLYCAGHLPRTEEFLCAACVGTRDATDYGLNMSYTISYDLAKSGAVIVSGLALGIDAACHRAAIDAGRETIAVLGCGINVCYPPRNRSLMREIGHFGTVLTEYPPDTKPVGKNFPLRNRIICGICQCTIVFEADERSGSLITAELARKQGRALYAVPGNAGELNSLGTNKLIKSGAALVTSAADILRDYEFLYPDRVHPEVLIPLEIEKPKRILSFGKKKKAKTGEDNEVEAKPEKKTKKDKKDQNVTEVIPDFLSQDERTVLSAISRVTAVNPEELYDLGIPIPAVLSALTTLEIADLIEALPGGVYIRKI